MANLPATTPNPADDIWLSAILDAAEDPMVVVDATRRSLFWNAPFIQLWGPASPPLQGSSLQTTCPEPGEIQAWLQLQLASHESEGECWHALRLDDGRHFEVCKRPLRVLTLRADLWIFRDVTHKRQIEAGMAQQQEQLVALLSDLAAARDAADKANAAKSQFLANMSHELRTPLHGVIGMTRLAREHTPAGPGRDYLDKAGRSAQTLLRIVNEVLDFSKIEAGHMGLEILPFHLDELIEQTLASVEPLAREKGLALTSEISSPLLRGNPLILGDALRLQQVLVNLLGNALKFTETGYARLSLSLSEAPGQPAALRFAVTDSGIGLSPKAQEHIFDEFAQADGSTTRKYGGTGLGLAISRRLCRLMGGELQVTSAPGQGSTFSFTLPLQWAKEAPPPPQTPPLALPHHPLAGLRLLLVEDHPISQQLTQDLLHNWGAEVDIADNGAAALEHLRELPPGHYHLALLDLQMPELDGFALAQRIRANPRYKALTLLALSAHINDEDARRCQALGMAGTMLKPFEPEQLLARLLPYAPQQGPQALPDAAPEAAPRLVLQAPGLDTVAGLRRSGGQTELYLHLLKRFTQEYRQALPELQALGHRQDWPELTRRAHTLKGLAATLGAPALADAASTLQEMADTGQPQPSQQALHHLLQILTPLLAALENELP